MASIQPRRGRKPSQKNTSPITPYPAIPREFQWAAAFPITAAAFVVEHHLMNGDYWAVVYTGLATSAFTTIILLPVYIPWLVRLFLGLFKK